MLASKHPVKKITLRRASFDKKRHAAESLRVWRKAFGRMCVVFLIVYVAVCLCLYLPVFGLGGRGWLGLLPMLLSWLLGGALGGWLYACIDNKWCASPCGVLLRGIHFIRWSTPLRWSVGDALPEAGYRQLTLEIGKSRKLLGVEMHRRFSMVTTEGEALDAFIAVLESHLRRRGE